MRLFPQAASLPANFSAFPVPIEEASPSTYPPTHGISRYFACMPERMRVLCPPSVTFGKIA